MNFIKNGYCMICQDFKAYCVPFATVEVEYAIDTVLWYTVELPNGRREGFNETGLKYSKDEVEKMCEKKNAETESIRKDWLLNGLPAIRRFESIGR